MPRTIGMRRIEIAAAMSAHQVAQNMKTALTLIGIIALAMGLLWMGQGSGYIPWPASSFMISQTQWIYYGGALAAFGILLIIFARR
jgi:hypothetical protein